VSSIFLIYLTVFQSRLAALNLLLPLTGLAYQPSISLSRRLKAILEQRVLLDLSDPKNAHVFEYLLEKRLVGNKSRGSGRYKSYRLIKTGGKWLAEQNNGTKLDRFPVFLTDVWMSEPSLPSTIGVPTSDNSDEILELSYQLGLLSKTKNTWTAAGQLAAQIRVSFLQLISDPENPFLIGLEGMAYFRQVLEKDGLLIRELLREISGIESPFTRELIALRLPVIAERAFDQARLIKSSPPAIAEAKKFIALLKRTAAKRTSASRAPGVLEHRVSPRLEWLTDFGVLSKAELPKNAFEYSWTSWAAELLGTLDLSVGADNWVEDVCLQQWRSIPRWKSLRDKLPEIDLSQALNQGYRIMKRAIGPAPIREVCFVAGLLMPRSCLSTSEIRNELITWATRDKEITLSGGRYSREPELVHISTSVLNDD
jgi:hypothetical protein